MFLLLGGGIKRVMDLKGCSCEGMASVSLAGFRSNVLRIRL